MTVSRPRLLHTGDDIYLGGELHTVEAVSGAMVRLVNVLGTGSAVPLTDLLSNPSFMLVSAGRNAAPCRRPGCWMAFRSRLLSGHGGGNGTSSRSWPVSRQGSGRPRWRNPSTTRAGRHCGSENLPKSPN